MAKITIKGVLSGMGAVLTGIGAINDSLTITFIGTILLVITSLMIAGVIKW